MSITHELTVQPIVLSNDNGSDTAEYFGTASQQTAITDYIDDIWAQAGINVDWLAPTAWNNTDANQGNIGLSSVVSNGDAAGVDSDSPTVLNMYFVEDILAFSNPFSEYNAAGLAFIGGNGVTQYVGSNLLDFDGGRQTIASVVAHEIGHNLGLPHTGTALFQNLMNGSGTVQPNPPIDDDGERLTQEQINIALSSPLLVEVSTQMPDLNGDGFVGAADLDILLANWGSTTGTAATGDANGDGVTNQLDLDIVDAAWGTGTPSGGGVPEPGSLALLSLGGLVLLRRRQR
ncbi:MAG: zinc-dependent metalloprotease family protein [Planctomycetota bacterium]